MQSIRICGPGLCVPTGTCIESARWGITAPNGGVMTFSSLDRAGSTIEGFYGHGGSGKQYEAVVSNHVLTGTVLRVSCGTLYLGILYKRKARGTLNRTGYS